MCQKHRDNRHLATELHTLGFVEILPFYSKFSFACYHQWIVGAGTRGAPSRGRKSIVVDFLFSLPSLKFLPSVTLKIPFRFLFLLSFFRFPTKMGDDVC